VHGAACHPPAEVCRASSSKSSSPPRALLRTLSGCQGRLGAENCGPLSSQQKTTHRLLRSPRRAFCADISPRCPQQHWGSVPARTRRGLWLLPVASCIPVHQTLWQSRTSLSAGVLLRQPPGHLGWIRGAAQRWALKELVGGSRKASLLNVLTLGTRKIESSDCAWITWCFISFGARRGRAWEFQ